MTRARVLRSLEIALLVVGLSLGGWSAARLLEAHRTQSLPIEPVRVTMTLPGDAGSSSALPGDAGSSGTHPRPAVVAPPPGTVIGRFEVPSLKISTPVLEGSDDATLARGAGHIEDTPFPGEPGNVGIAGHRDTIFRPLEHVRRGEVLQVRTADHVYRYTVTRTLIVNPDDVYVLDDTATPTLTLVTCYPFRYVGHAPKRFIVQAALEP
jgi:sortase A